MQKTILPPRLAYDGWIYDGFEYPEDFFDHDHMFCSCHNSHPLKLHMCVAPPGDLDEISTCTSYEPIEDPPPDGSYICAHWTSTAGPEICEKHLDIPRYLKQYPYKKIK